MKSFRDIKLECVKLASMLATAKLIRPDDVIPRAMEYERWITGTDEKATSESVSELARRYAGK